MGLLAGEKRKQKIGLDPNNLTWAKDTNSVGQSMLKKMGWKQGAGLGANEDGRVVPVKASMKSNMAGLGCSAQQADAWIAHGEEFDQILASLNASTNKGNDKDDSGSIKSSKEEVEGQRRYYGRFSRGGVKQSRTAEDLNCIFGRRKTSAVLGNDAKKETTFEDNSNSLSDKMDSQDSNIDKSHGFETVTSSYSVQDYFAQKLMKLKQKKADGDDVIKPLETAMDKQDEKEEGVRAQDLNTYVTSSLSVNDYFMQKRRFKNVQLKTSESTVPEEKGSDCEKGSALFSNQSCVTEGTFIDSGEERNQSDSNSKEKKNKKKKRKKQLEDNDIKENDVDNNDSISVSCTTDKAEKKKNRKKRKAEDIETAEVENVNCFPDASFVSKKPKKKAKKTRREEDTQVCNENLTVDENDVVAEVVSKKKKKKRKAVKDAEVSGDDDTSLSLKDTDVVPGEENELTKKKKKKKKKRHT